MTTLKFSERLACRLAGQHRTTQRHPPASQSVGDPDADLRGWLRDHAGAHPRWGHRRAYHDARGEGWVVNHKKVQRLWREEGLRVPQRRRCKRAGTPTAPIRAVVKPDDVGAADFPFDATTDGRAVKVVSIVDEHTRETHGGLVERNITAHALTGELDRIVAIRGTGPIVLRSDNGPEFACTAMADWAGARTGLWFIPPAVRPPEVS